MGIFTRVGALVLAASPLLFGCAPGGPGETDEDVGAAEQADKFGAGGTNGLDTDLYYAFEDNLVLATYLPLVKSGGMEVNPAVGALLLNDEHGKTVFDYAMKCALPRRAGSNTVIWNGEEHTGGGILNSGAEWLLGPLSDTARHELLACMAAHLNPFEIHVDILLSGPDTDDDGLEHPKFNVDEALWVVRRNVDGTLVYVVWPLESFQKMCSSDPFVALQRRVCGQDPEGCTLTRGEDEDCVYDSEAEGYYCLGAPALMTTLRESDIYLLNSSCF